LPDFPPDDFAPAPEDFAPLAPAELADLPPPDDFPPEVDALAMTVFLFLPTQRRQQDGNGKMSAI
jgi:hypothetical protein